jgi:Outer membrane protein beta-barrel domain
MNKQLLAALSISVVTGASAQVYGVISAGNSRLSLDCGNVSVCDKSSSGYKLLGGYKFRSNVAVEAGYFDFGTARFGDNGAEASIATTAFGVGAAFHPDFGPHVAFVARVGLARVKTKLDGAAAVPGVGSGSINVGLREAQVYAGLGIGYKIGNQTSIGLSWDTTKSTVSIAGGSDSGNVNTFGIGVTFGF